MKSRFTSISKYVAAAALAAVCCLPQQSNAQVKKEEEAPPKGTASLAGVGAKPSKAELAKKNAGEGEDTTATAGNQKTATMQQTTGGNALSAMDRQFMMMAGKDGMKEVHMGQMAVQQGQSPEIKKLGSTIVADHTKANNQLMEIATKRGVKLDVRHKMDKMSKRDMENFDQAWLAMMVNDHQKDIAAYERQAKMGTDPELKAFAKKTLPVLQKHLKLVQAAQKKMGSTATAPRDPSATAASARR